MYAIIKASGKQYKVEVGSVVELDRQGVEVGETILLEDSVLLVGDGEKVTVGTPTVKGATVKLEVVDHFRGPKLIVFKMKRRKRYRNKQGHRQDMTRCEVKDIALA